MSVNYSPRFTEWARKYGEIYSVKLGPGTGIVITSPQLVKQLVDKKSNIYSNRPPSYIGNKIISDDDHMLLFQYDEKWRKARKIFHQYFMESIVTKQHLPLVNAEAVQMLRDFGVQPENFMRHPQRFSNSIIVSLRMWNKLTSV